MPPAQWTDTRLPRDVPLPRIYAASLLLLSFSLAHGTFSFARTGAGSNMGYKTLTHRARAASVGPCLGSPFRLLVVLSTVARSRGHCPRSIPSKRSVLLFIHPRLRRRFVLPRIPPPSLGPLVPPSIHYRPLASWRCDSLARRCSGHI
jgi:hypothetical protein